jgi:hypothetical protein
VLLVGAGFCVSPLWNFAKHALTTHRLSPDSIASMDGETAADLLTSALEQGIITYQSTADTLLWLKNRPNMFKTIAGDKVTPLQRAGVRTARFPAGGQAWIIVAENWLMPVIDLKNPTPQAVFSALDRQVNTIRNRAEEFASVQPLIAERIKDSLRYLTTLSGEQVPREVVLHPISELKLLSAALPKIDLKADFERVASWGDKNAADDTEFEKELGTTFLTAAESAQAANQPWFAAKGIALYMNTQESSPQEGKRTSNAVIDIRSKILPIVEAEFLKYQARQECPNLDLRTYPFSVSAAFNEKMVDILWAQRIRNGEDQLCQWFPTSWVPTNPLVVKESETVAKIINAPKREGDWLRRQVLVNELSTYVFQPEDYTGATDAKFNPDCPSAYGDHCAELSFVVKAIRPRLLPPPFRFSVEGQGKVKVTLNFRDPRVAGLWKDRLSPREFEGTALNWQQALGAKADALKPILAKCPATFKGEIWERNGSATKIGLTSCATFPGVNPPRGESRDIASDLQYESYKAAIVIKKGEVRSAWLPPLGRPNEHIIAVTDLDRDGDPEIVTHFYAATCNYRGCEKELTEISVYELIQEGFSYFHNDAIN